MNRRYIFWMLFVAILVMNANAQFIQQGAKLIGTGAVGNALLGSAVSISSDGNTAIVGGPGDNNNEGAAWIFTRIGGIWSQQGQKLVGTGSVGAAQQGYSVSISADGNTAIFGGWADNNAIGAAWIFVRANGVWTQQGEKLVGSGWVDHPSFGRSVSISANGNTVIVGGPVDEDGDGAAWVFIRNGGIWTQEGAKLMGTGGLSGPHQGTSVSISADGNTAILGGPGDDSPNIGAAWIFTRNGNVWTQQGTKLVGSGFLGDSNQGMSVSISSDGNTAIIGGNIDNQFVGASWVFTRSGGVWTQQGAKLVGTGGSGSRQGYSVSISSDGNTAIVGGPFDSNGGSSWVFVRSGGVWNQQGMKLVGTGGSGSRQGYSVAISSDGNTAIVGGPNDSSNTGAVWVFVKLEITRPRTGELWIAGEQDTIRWTGGQAGQFINIDFINDTTTGLSESIVQNYPADSGKYVWDKADTILTRKCEIYIEDASNPSIYDSSGVFKIKGYVLTRKNSEDNYEAYDNTFDRWAFPNTSLFLWDPNYYSQFNYQGIDTFTNSDYPSWQGQGVFHFAESSDFPDWPSFVNTFGVNVCYLNLSQGIYSLIALRLWWIFKDNWAGSCFGMAISNMLYFSQKQAFINRYANFPDQMFAGFIGATPYVKSVINEIWTHQFGNPFRDYNISIKSKTPNQTLKELKEMLLDKDENMENRCINFYNNTGSGGHAVTPYLVKADPSNPTRYFVYVYDNSRIGNSNSRFIIQTTGSNGNGSWTNIDWPTWGGNTNFYVSDPVTSYLSNATLSKNTDKFANPFVSGPDYIDVWNTLNASIIIKDSNGNQVGYSNNLVIDQMPGAFPFIPSTGSETPPYGYILPTGSYSIEMKDFSDSESDISFFTINSVFDFERYDASSEQDDKLYFDDGLSFYNPDQTIKSINLTNIVNEGKKEKLTSIRAFNMQQNDSVKVLIENTDNFKVISFGSSKNYEIELEFNSGTQLGRFNNPNISLPTNSSHTFLPNWNDLSGSSLKILLDLGNDGTIDDTITVINTVDVDDQGLLLHPSEYNLAQNYPNPFNPTTTIRYSVPKNSLVTLKVYDILGNEITTLVNEEKTIGTFEVKFDASGLASGIYFYQLKADNYSNTKKLILMK